MINLWRNFYAEIVRDNRIEVVGKSIDNILLALLATEQDFLYMIQNLVAL